MGGTGAGWLTPEVLMAPSIYLHAPASGTSGSGLPSQGEGWGWGQPSVENLFQEPLISKLLLEWQQWGWE